MRTFSGKFLFLGGIAENRNVFATAQENQGVLLHTFLRTVRTFVTAHTLCVAYAPINVKPQGGEAGYRRGI